ncbi:YkgJ family cysteine cluster protein [Stutzerimonas nosocomialis]|uniref:YkgJ family cysteine cluster protein n=1 Tax=Stutzerimonas nosocomialis TaxID=1056496 RepID=A0A5R9QGY5_9GAMM|nr:YkgJ family cysteine cluster protein [Stutzerimonas nosocomialis]TLX54549.1 YkgJ family cysteine cluster protein [Stutzerimonas nosocomialis]TLX61319.1 YkgJ family cysteine cluster protein [Stutzerimonas nosocomialis]TLX64122.1 YkgJ family cysteine cluster protein [Stutzerimonas nosocomialis]
MKPKVIPAADLDRLETWPRYSNGMCRSCDATCCTLPVETRIDDLIRIGVVDAFERDEPGKSIAKRLIKMGVVERFNQKTEVYTLVRLANNDCLYLDRVSRLCTIYDKRPETCRNHPRIGPRPGHCAYRPKAAR